MPVQFIIAFKNTLLYAKKHKLIFSIFIIVQAVSLLATVYVFAIVQANANTVSNVFTNLRSFTVSLSNTNYYENVKFANAFITKNENIIEGLSFIDENILLQIDIIIGGENNLISNGRYIRAANEVVLSSLNDDNFRHIPIGADIEFLGVTFTVVGKTNSINNIICYTSTIGGDVEFELNRLTFYLNTIPDSLIIDKITNDLSHIFDGAIIHPPSITSYSEDAIIELIIVCSIFALSLLNASYLYRYILETRKKYVIIMRICGFSKFRSVINIISENTVTLLFLFITNYVISRVTLPILLPLFTNNHREFSMILSDFLLIYAIYSVLFLLIFTSTVRKTLSSVIRGNEK
ncbi:MAG: hypothetical protein LBC71_09100 [Oscillospiraceae bacterium]|jgi:hypothetical protein|nr:hypothetical protein [Oscillospiraceae bacterium]